MRLDMLRGRMNAVILATPDPAEIPYYFSHLYGVSECATLLALRRGLDAEIAASIGLLHDIKSCMSGYTDTHGQEGAALAESLLTEMGLYTIEEIACISDAIRHHSDKKTVHGAYAELLKDADTLQPCLLHIDSHAPLPANRARHMQAIAAELCIPNLPLEEA